MTNSLTEKAILNFRSGLNCAQTVIHAYADALRLDENLALSISCGFGGGMGRLQETCGAVTGSFMVLGVYNCRKYSDNKDRKETTYAMVQEFNKKFREIHGTTNCHDLLKCDLTTEEGKKYAHDHNLYEVVCEKCIVDSFKIINDLMQV
jgi:C_GCAxxG_C_C family probable redox protein